MQNFEGIAAAADAVRRFYFRNEDDLPEHVKARLATHVNTGGSPVDLIVNFTKAAYANRDLPAPAMEIAAGTADVIAQQGFHGGLDGKAAGMVAIFRRESGEKAPAGTSWPKPADDPAADSDFAPPPAPAPVEPAGEA